MKTTILFGSETGNAESLAEMAATQLNALGLEAEAKSMDTVKAIDLAEIPQLLIITSTWGDGDPPTNAWDLWGELGAKPAINLSNVRYSVLALGDSGYPQFCKCGKDFDEWLEELGATRIVSRVDCDLDFEAPFQTWLDEVIAVLQAQPTAAA